MCYDSFESEELKKLIDNKKKFFAKQTNKTAAQYLQKEILFLQNEILPVILNNTTIFHYEAVKYLTRTLDLAAKYDCNGALTYFPLNDYYVERPRVGVFNSRDLMMGTPGAVLISIINMDIAGTTVEPVNLHLNALV